MNPETYDWYQCDEEDYNSNDSPEEQAEALRARQDYAAQLIAAMRAAVAQVPPYCERYQNEAALEQELTAFDQKYLAEHGVYPALCDLPEHLISVATR